VKTGFIENGRTLRGELRYKAYKHENGEKKLVEEFASGNMILDAARNQMTKLLAGEFDGRNITRIGFGTGAEEAASADVMLTEPFVKELEGYEFTDDGKVYFNWSLEIGDANGKAISEFGLYCGDGTLFARRRRENKDGEYTGPLNKEEDISLEGVWVIYF
jgi:hypothetical protein